MKGQGDNRAWTLYWQANRLDSCLSSEHHGDEVEIFQFWASSLAPISSGGKIIDLATGNGAVAIRLAQAARARDVSIAIDAVDLAEINPVKYLVDYHDVAPCINFTGGVDIGTMPFEDDSFDLAVSQFGFEYADQDAACAEMIRVLKPGGRFQMLLHHASGKLVQPNVARIAEIDLLLSEGGVVASVIDFLAADAADRAGAMVKLEAAGRTTQESMRGASARVAGEIFSSIGQLLERNDLAFDYRLNAALDMQHRLLAERERMRQLAAAALDETAMNQLVDMLMGLGAKDVGAGAYFVGRGDSRALLAWQLSGRT